MPPHEVTSSRPEIASYYGLELRGALPSMKFQIPRGSDNELALVSKQQNRFVDLNVGDLLSELLGIYSRDLKKSFKNHRPVQNGSWSLYLWTLHGTVPYRYVIAKQINQQIPQKTANFVGWNLVNKITKIWQKIFFQKCLQLLEMYIKTRKKILAPRLKWPPGT